MTSREEAKQPMTHDSLEALKAERAKLVADNEAAASWGAAVGARLERIKEIDRALLSLTASSPGEPDLWGDSHNLTPPIKAAFFDGLHHTLKGPYRARYSIPLYTSAPPAAGWDEEYPFDDERFNKGVQHVVELIARELGVTDWIAGDGSEDYDCDLWQTILNILAAKGIYDKDEGEFKALCREAPAPKGVADTTIRPSDWKTILAGIKKFGLAADGSDIRDLEAALKSRPDAGGGVRVKSLEWNERTESNASAEARLREVLANARWQFDRLVGEYPVNHGSKFCLNIAKAAIREIDRTLSGGDEAKKSEGAESQREGPAQMGPVKTKTSPSALGAGDHPSDPTAERREIVARLLTTAKLLLQNAVGCATNHYAHDCELNGLPGWLRDCERDIEAVAAALDGGR
jgi:hypothetical protein